MRGWPENDPSVSCTRQQAYTYDGDGRDPHAIGNRVTSVASGTGVATVTEHTDWTARGQLRSRTTTTSWEDGVTQGPYTVAFGYDNRHRATRLTYPTLEGLGFSSVIYAYDNLGRLTGVSDEQGKAFAGFTYDAAGNPASVNAGPLDSTLGYDAPGNLLSVQGATSGGAFDSVMSFQADGSLHTQQDTLVNGTAAENSAFTYGYDALGRITSSSNAQQSSWSQGFSYEDAQGTPDLNGNLHTLGGAALTYVSGRNQLQQVAWSGGGSTAYTYLDNGALQAATASGTDSPSLGFTYVPGTRLPASITLGNAVSVQYAYDGDGNRAGKRVLEGATAKGRGVSIKGPHRPLAQVDETGVPTAFIYGPTGLICMVRGGVRYTVATDRMGSARMVFNPDGSVAASYSYLPFGGTASAAEPTPGFLPLRYTGAELDAETGLYHLNARLYDARLGRFCSTDPAQQYPSPYLYVGDHPTAFVDPTGRISEAGQVGLFFATGAVATAGLLLGLLVPVAGVGELAALGALSGALTGAGFAGMEYDVSHSPSDWSWLDFTYLVGLGALGGEISGGISGGVLGLAGRGAKAGAQAIGEQAVDDALGEATEAKAASSHVASEGGEEGPAPEGAPSLSVEAAAGTSESVQSAADQAWQTFRQQVPYRVVGSALGYTVAGMVRVPLTNFLYGEPPGYHLLRQLGMYAVEGAAMGLVAGGLSYADAAWGISSSAITGIKAMSLSEGLIWGGILGVGGTTIIGAAGTAGFLAANAVLKNYGTH